MPVNPTPVYSDLNDEEIDAESPLTESVMTRLRDNPRAVFRNDVSVPTIELQLAEGMRTALADNHVIKASAGKMVDGGIVGEANTIAYADEMFFVSGNRQISVTLPATGTFIAHVSYGVSSSNTVCTGQCVIVNNVIQAQTTAVKTNTTGTVNLTAFVISGGQIHWRFGSSIGNIAILTLIKIA